MKKIGSVLVVLIVLALFSGVALAGCEDDCLLTFETCLKLCRQTTKEDSEEAGKCGFHCMKGRDGCLKRCEARDKKSENTGDSTEVYLRVAGGLLAGHTDIVLGANCIEQGLQCTLNGTPCCAPYKCKGTFPNTYCQE